MKHIDPDPSARKIEKYVPIAKQKNKRSLLKFFLAGLAFIVAGGYSATYLFGEKRTDNVPDAKKAELATAFNTMDRVKLTLVTTSETAAAIESMRLAPDARQKLKAALVESDSKSALSAEPAPAQKPDNLRLAWVSLWDSFDVDGDSVHLSSAGYEVDILLGKAPQRIAVPVDASGQIRITGLHDGGGGITLGIQEGTSKVLLPILAPGQSLIIPIAY